MPLAEAALASRQRPVVCLFSEVSFSVLAILCAMAVYQVPWHVGRDVQADTARIYSRFVTRVPTLCPPPAQADCTLIAVKDGNVKTDPLPLSITPPLSLSSS